MFTASKLVDSMAKNCSHCFKRDCVLSSNVQLVMFLSETKEKSLINWFF